MLTDIVEFYCAGDYPDPAAFLSCGSARRHLMSRTRRRAPGARVATPWTAGSLVRSSSPFALLPPDAMNHAFSRQMAGMGP